MRMWEFLMHAPPGKKVKVTDLAGGSYPAQPAIFLRCDSDNCRADMWFDCQDYSGSLEYQKWIAARFQYRCRHCNRTTKWFAFLAKWTDSSSAEAIKLGEEPPFGPHTPPGVISLVGPARELFLKGRASEARGLGIGAFTYYRRVVDSQWERLINAAIGVSERLELPSDILKQAKAEQQFSKAVEMVKDAIPQTLLIKGHNPMTLLYKALSEGVHELTDDQCLEQAKAIRVILIDFAERVGEALKDRKEVEDALTKLFQGEDRQETSADAKSQPEEEPEIPTE